MIGGIRFFGHRGARAVAPENTLEGLRRGLADGAVGLEFDVRATRDDALVLLHDATLDRTTSGHGLLAEHDLDVVRRLDAGSGFAAEFAGARVPTLGEVLEEFLGRAALDIELKEQFPEAPTFALARRLDASDARSADVFVSSFHVDVLERFAILAPRIPRGLLLDRGDKLPTPERVRALGASMVIAHESSIDKAFADGCGALGLPLHTYTVNDGARVRTLASLGVSIVITDDPRRLRDECGG